MFRKKYNSIVVGGGIGGLSVSALLADRGEEVLLLERSRNLGGRAKSFEYKPGFTVDCGIHLCRYGEDGEAAKTLRRLGLELDFVSPGRNCFFENGSIYKDLRGILELLSFSSIRPLLSLLMKVGEDDIEDYLDTSLEDWLANYDGDDEDVRRIFRLLSSSLLVSPIDKFDASLGEMLRTLKNVIGSGESGAYPIGGWSTIIHELRDVIESGRGRIRTATPVDEVVIREGKVHGVKVEDRVVEADRVILGMKHQFIDRVVDPRRLPDQYLEKCKSLESNAGISFDIGTSEVVTDIDGLILSSQVPLIGMVTSNIDPSVAPEDKQLMTFLFIHSQDEIRDHGFVKERIKRYRKMLHEMIPGLKEHVEWERVMRMWTVDGAALTTDQHYEKRLGVETPIDDLYFASDTCGVPGGGGDIPFAAARECVDTIYE